MADATLDFDRNEKLPIYAEAGIPEYWIVNLIDREIEVYRHPRADGTYASESIVRAGDNIEILAFSGVRVAVNEVLP